MTACPTTTPCTRPALSTVATLDVDVSQVIERPVSTTPLASTVVAESCVLPFTTMVADGGVTTTAATSAPSPFTIPLAHPMYAKAHAAISATIEAGLVN